MTAVISMATTPWRINRLRPTLESLMRQTVRLPIAISVHDDCEQPDWLSMYNGVTVIKTEASDSHRKYYMPFVAWKEPTHLITVDDDLLYSCFFVQTILKNAADNQVHCWMGKVKNSNHPDTISSLSCVHVDKQTEVVHVASGMGVLIPRSAISCEKLSCYKDMFWSDEKAIACHCHYTKTKMMLDPHIYQLAVEAFPSVGEDTSKSKKKLRERQLTGKDAELEKMYEEIERGFGVDAFEIIGEAIDGYDNKELVEASLFYSFEPWDVEKRPAWMIEQARMDGIDINAPEFIRHVGTDPHPFQSGYLQSTAFLRCLLAGTSVGKSYVAFMGGVVNITGEIPVALRFEKGVDTGVRRLVSRDNVVRFGRRDISTGSIIDHNPEAERDLKAWDCGNITGSGKYPTEKIAEFGGELWIGTYMKAQNEYWWPRFHDPAHMIIPSHLIDRTRGHNGYNVQDRTVYLIRGGKLVIITYETGYNRFEAQRVHEVILDEEPDDERIFQAAQQRSKFLSMVETPYRGMTYTKRIMFPETTSPDKVVFHATQYDSPYQDNEKIEIRRKSMNPWDIGARIWGLHSEVRGQPYYDRTKITGWANRFTPSLKLGEFLPEVAETIYSETQILLHERAQRDSCGVWELYEDVEPGVPYVMAVDPAEGSENPEDAADVCAAMIARPTRGKEQGIMREVASLRSSLETIPFARCCRYAAQYYNNSLMAAETKRAACNAAFAMEMADYEFWYRMTTVQQSTRRARQIKGFDTNAATRMAIFELIKEWLGDYEKDEHPNIPDQALLKELAACVVGKNGRPDHTTEGTLDTTICFGILLYVFKNSAEQVICNKEVAEDPDESRAFGKLLRHMNEEAHTSNKNIGLGEGMPHWR